MSEQLSDQDTRDVEIIADATGIPADVVLQAAQEAAEEDGVTVSEELEPVAQMFANEA